MPSTKSKIVIVPSTDFPSDRLDLGFWRISFSDHQIAVSPGVFSILELQESNEFHVNEIIDSIALNDLKNGIEEDLNKTGEFDISESVQFHKFDKWVRISGVRKADSIEGTIEDLSELKYWQQQQKKRAEKALEHKEILLDIANANSKDWPMTLEEITSIVSRSMDVERVGIWKFNEGRTEIKLELLHNLSTNSYEKGSVLKASEFPKYFKALETNYNIVANDAMADPQTNEFRESYLKPMGITSMMDVFIQVNGEYYGIICHEHVGPKRVWTEEEQEFAASIAALISLKIEREQRTIAEQALFRSEEKYKGIFNSLVNIYFQVNKSGEVSEISPSCEKIIGYMPSEIIGKSFSEALKMKIDRETVVQQLMKNGQISNLVIPAQHKEGHEIFLEINTKLIDNPEESSIAAICIARDVTEIKSAEEKISKSLHEKELLLRELSHRTKNNLQVIQSMIALKLSMTNDEKLAQIGREIIGKIQAMALVHRKLYQSKNVSMVNVSEYVKELTDLIAIGYTINLEEISVEMEIPKDLEMTIDTITPFGLVLNELLTNSFKYAFDPGKKGHVTINLTLNDKDNVLLTYRDNGKGFDTDYDLATAPGLGLPTVFSLINTQMMGKVTQPVATKAHYEITFPLSVHTDRI